MFYTIKENTEAYRSGHNEAVLKTVWAQAHGGSSPSASAKAKKPRIVCGIFCVLAEETEMKRFLVAYCRRKADIRRGAPALAWETALSCLLNLSKAQCLPFKVFLEETGFLEPARFACLKKICRKGNRLRRKTPRRETCKREKNAIEISMLKKITPGGATVF